MKITLKFWMRGKVLCQVAGILEELWTALAGRCEKLALSADPEFCHEEVLDLIAFERGIVRMKDEDMALYRRRVKYALANAMDAGSAAGFERIWQRLKLGRIVQHERPDEENWDTVYIEIDEAGFARYSGLFSELVALYGRTCRYYVLKSATLDTLVAVGVNNFEMDIAYLEAKIL